MNEDTTELQRQVTHAALDALREHPFALAGFGAIREHGFIRRLSHDVARAAATRDREAIGQNHAAAMQAFRAPVPDGWQAHYARTVE